MKTSILLRFLGLTAAASLTLSQPALAADGTWTALSGGDASGAYNTSGNWAGSIVADGSGFTADFSTLDISAASTVTLDGAHTLGNLIFGDTSTATAASWIFGNSGNTLTLAGTTPTITVNALGTGASATINVTIGGSSGLTKAGNGLLILSSNNTYTGTTAISAGTVRLGNAGGVGTGTGGINVASGAAFDVNAFLIASTNKIVTISGNGSGAGALINTGAGTGAVRQLNFSTAATVGGTGRLDVGFGATAISGGTNTLTKTGSNQFTVNAGAVTVGTIDVQQGTFSVVNNSGGLGDTTYGTTVANGAILALYQNGASAMSVAENITLASGAELRSSRSQLAMTLTGSVALTSGTSAINVLTTGGDANTFTISGNLTGLGGFTKTGNGLLILTGSNSYANGTTVSAGTLQGNAVSLQGAIANNAALIFNQAATGTYASILSGSGTLDKTGAGNLTLSGSNTFTGAATVSQGTLTLGHGSALGTTTGNTTVASGATIDLNGQNIGGEEVRISGAGVGGDGALVNNAVGSATGLRLTALSDATIGGSGRIDTAYTGTVTNAGNNTLTKKGAGSFVINVGTTSMGTLLVNEGSVVSVNSATSLGDTNFGTSVASGASLQFYNNTGSEIANSEAITLANGAELAGTQATSQNTLNGEVALTGGQANVRVEDNGVATLKLGGAVTGAGGINKISGGTLLLTNVNTYTGNTTVTGGTLTLADNAELRFVIGASGTNNGIDGAGILSLNGDFRFDLTGAGTTVGNSWQIVDVASLSETFGGTFQALSTFGAFSNSGDIWSITENGADYEFSQSTGYLTVVPEPSTCLLVGLGISTVLLRRRRRGS